MRNRSGRWGLTRLMLLRTLKPAGLKVEQKYVIKKKKFELGTKTYFLKVIIHLLKLPGFILVLCDIFFKELFKKMKSVLAYDKI